MRKGIFIFVFLFIILSVTLINAVPPVTIEFIGEERLVIEANIVDYYKTDTSACIHIFVFNQSNGNIANDPDISCRVELTNDNGTIIINGNLIPHDDHFQMCRNDTVLTERGDYGLMIVCNNSEVYGFKTGFFGLNNYGEVLTEAIEGSHNNAMWFLMILFGFGLFGLIKIDSLLGKFALYWFCHVLFVVGTFAEWNYLHGYALSQIVTEGIFKVLFFVSITAMLPMMILSIAWMIIMFSQSKDIQGLIDRGSTEEDATERILGGKR